MQVFPRARVAVSVGGAYLRLAMVTFAHASVPTAEDRAPFEHAVALAARAGAHLISVHAGKDPTAARRMLDAATVLEGWGLEVSAVEHDRVVYDCCDDPVDTMLDWLRRNEPDLVIAATHQRKGVVRVLFESRAEAIAENVRVPTLLVPIEGRGFVTSEGSLDLKRVVLPIGDAEAAAIAVERVAWLVDLARADEVEVILLYVGAPGTGPELTLPDHPRIRFNRIEEQGPLENVIAARAADANAIVMATRGHDSFGDMMRGSHTERVLRKVSCPVLSVPILDRP